MKLAVISDIHANPSALKAVLADAKAQGCGRTICLGDIVGYGYDPNACIDICRENQVECIMGNHDAGVVGNLKLSWFSSPAKDCLKRHIAEVDAPRKEWLKSLEFQKREDFGAWRCGFSHGTFANPEEFGYIEDSADAELEMEYMQMRGCDILFVGHTHSAEAYARDLDGVSHTFETRTAPDLTINPNGYRTLVVNVGSVGYPRFQPCSFYTIFDTDEQRIRFRPLPFDFEEYIAEMEKRGIAVPLWTRAQMEVSHG